MVTVTPEILRAIAKAANPEYKPNAAIIAGIAEWWHVAHEAGIDTVNEAAGFLGNACIETGGFRTLKEDGGLSYFKKYEGRKDLGNTVKGYGVKYFGRGIFQNTGYANMVELSSKLGADFVKTPQLLETPEWSMKAAVDYWDTRRLGPYADSGNFVAVGRGINRGNPKHKGKANHEDERLRACKMAVTLLGKAPPKFVVDRDIILEVQTLLAAKGWPEVGAADGKEGPRTSSAILAYRNEQTPPLPLSTAIDKALLKSLRTGPDRKVSVTRAATTATELAQAGEPTITNAGTIKTVAGAGGVLSVIGGVDQQGVTDRLKDAVSGAGALRETAEEALGVLQWLTQKWWLPVLLICAYLIYKSSKIVRQRVADYRTGKAPGV